ncbi:MAG TPA: 1-acyl-sn-glycerol-3-phosphate acyltransferase, partial [Isosphaeraceae bacterium]
MNRLPLRDEIPYRFFPPRVSPFWVRASRLFIKYLLRRLERVRGIEFVGVEHLASLLGRGDGILIAPNHPDLADCGVIFELGRRVKRPFCYMAAYQIFSGGAGLKRFILPRLGVFPVDREGADRKAYASGVDVLLEGKNPLVIFPEGEVYHLADRLTPIREGAAALAVTA